MGSSSGPYCSALHRGGMEVKAGRNVAKFPVLYNFLLGVHSVPVAQLGVLFLVILAHLLLIQSAEVGTV